MLLMFACFSFLILACNKEKLEGLIDKSTSNQRIGDNYQMFSEREALLQLDIESQKQHMELMTPEERYAIWENNMQQVLSLDIWNAGQREALEDMYNHLQVEAFSNDSTSAGSLEFDHYFNIWYEAAKTKFEANQVIGVLGLPANYAPIVDPGGDVDYGCNQSYDWCLGSDCSVKCALPTRRGCGGFWRHSCNGACG